MSDNDTSQVTSQAQQKVGKRKAEKVSLHGLRGWRPLNGRLGLCLWLFGC